MASDEFDVIVVGGGAAGIAAARRLHDAGTRCLLVEARDRLGGRAWSVEDGLGSRIDLGCGWLHSADRNPWAAIARAEGLTIDETPPPWMRPSIPIGFLPAEQAKFFEALRAFHERLGGMPDEGPDRAAATFLEPGGRWNGLISAVSTYLSGVEPDRFSARDFARYDDTAVNWRVVEGYGTMIAAHAKGVPVRLSSPVTRIDRTGARLRIDTAGGALTAGAVIVTLPSALVGDERLFHPALPEKVEAAAGLPLGLDDKLFLSLEGADEFDRDSRLFGRIDRVGTGAYHFRPFGRPQIEAFFGGTLAEELEAGGEAAFFDFAVGELTARLGSDFARRVKPIRTHLWRADPFARGSYSYALPGKADCRAALAAPVEDRIFFAGEACSVHDYSTAHGAYLTGIAAAEAAIAARAARR